MMGLSAHSILNWVVHGDFTGILDRSKLSLALSVRPDAVLFLGAAGGDQTVNIVRVPRAMGLAASGHRLAVGSDRAVAVYINTPELAPRHPANPDVYDAYYVARTIHVTGPSDWHDMAFIGDRLVATNTQFSCICTIDSKFSFTPVWHPPFISRLCPEDRCHLNGFGVEGDDICYATTLSKSDERRGWRKDPNHTGHLIDVHANKIMRADLCMPHSPRVIDGRLFVLNGGEGELLEIDRITGLDRCLARLPGFTHGLAHHGDHLFVGLSHNRVSRAADPPPVARRFKTLYAGVAAIDIHTGRVEGAIEFKSGVGEVYDVQALPGVRCASFQSLEAADEFSIVDTPHAKFWVNRNN